MTTDTYVYFIKPIGMDGPIKIGCSAFTGRRLEDLAAWSPFPLELIGSAPGSVYDEHFLHACFAESHSHREWFHSTPALREAIKIALDAGSLEPLFTRLVPRGSIRKNKNFRDIWTPDQRLRVSYENRIRWAEQALRDSGIDAYFAPAEIKAAMGRWARPKRPVRPSDEQIALIDRFLADPRSLAYEPEWSKRLRIEIAARKAAKEAARAAAAATEKVAA